MSQPSSQTVIDEKITIEASAAAHGNPCLPLKLFAIACCVRLILWAIVSINHVAPAYDEVDYMHHARAWHIIFTAWLIGRPPAPSAWHDAYGFGIWPPLHPILLGFGMFLPFDSVAASRLMVVITASFTTPLVYSIGRLIGNDRTAHVAAWIFIAYPPFLAFSHFLWSESLFTLLLLGAVYTVLVIRAKTGSMTRYAIQAGICLGLAALTRAAAIPIFITLLVFLAIYSRPSERIRVLALTAIPALLIALPWLVALRAQEGHFVPLSTSGGFNAYIGNSPWSTNAIGTPPNISAVTDVADQLRATSGHQNENEWDATGRRLAGEYIAAHPTAFVVRCVRHLWGLWQPDSFLMRHIRDSVYPDVPSPLRGFIGILVMVGYLVIIVGAAIALLSRKSKLQGRKLFLTIALVNSVLPALTFASPRFNYPIMVLLVPVAAYGVSGMRASAKVA